MNIVFVSREYVPTSRGGGIASYVYEMSLSLSRKGHTVTVLCASDDTRMSSDTMRNGVRVIRLSGGDFVIPGVEKTTPVRKFRAFYRFFSYRRKILDALRRIDGIDIIEAPEYGAEAYFLSRLNIPVVIRLHTPTLLDRDTFGIRRCGLRTFVDCLTGRRELEVLRKARYVTSCSESLKRWFARYLPEVTDKIRVIYNPIDTALWTREDTEYSENTILYVGTVAESKGIGDLVGACALVRRRGTEVNLRIAGKKDGSFALKLRQDVRDSNYEWCSFLGNLDRDSLRREYSSAKIACFPSWWENLPLVCLEAMLAGNVVVGSRNGGMAEIISDGVDGFLIEPRNAEAMVDKLEYALSLNAAAVSRIRANAKEKIESRFSMESVIEEMETYYEGVIDDFKKNM